MSKFLLSNLLGIEKAEEINLSAPIFLILLATLIITLWPNIKRLLDDLFGWKRVLEKEKLRLEVIKLRYELEILRNTDSIQPSDNDLIMPLNLEALLFGNKAKTKTVTDWIPEIFKKPISRILVLQNYYMVLAGFLSCIVTSYFMVLFYLFPEVDAFKLWTVLRGLLNTAFILRACFVGFTVLLLYDKSSFTSSLFKGAITNIEFELTLILFSWLVI